MVHDSSSEQPGRRARERARRLDEIMTEAMAMLRSDGLDALTTHRLAERLELAVGALYRYFPSKAHLLAALEGLAIDALRAHLRSNVAAPETATSADDVLSRLVALAHAYRSFARKHPSEFALITQLLSDPRTLVPGAGGGTLVDAAFALLGDVAAYFARAHALGALTPCDAMVCAVLYTSALRSVIELNKLKEHTDAVDVDTWVDGMARTLLAGWGAHGAALDRAFAQDPTSREHRR
jgi:AcrR family transcriptional regulator